MEEKRMRQLFLPVLGLALTYIVVGPLVLMFDWAFFTCSVPYFARIITLISLSFFFYSLISLSVYNDLIAKKSRVVTGYYLMTKIIRMLLTLSVILAYGLLGGSNILLFSINMFIFYIVTVLYLTVYSIRIEKRNKLTR